MTIERPLETGQSRRIVYCKLSNLTANADGTYSFTNLPTDAIGLGSEIYVINSNMKLLYDNITNKLYVANYKE